MSKAEAFSQMYRLTPGGENLLNTVLTGHERAIRLSQAMIERAKEMGAKAKMQFLAAAILEDRILRLYFRDRDGMYLKDVAMISGDYPRDLFLDLLAYEARNEMDLFYDGEEFFLEIKHRPN